jgi:hypothetical protein
MISPSPPEGGGVPSPRRFRNDAPADQPGRASDAGDETPGVPGFRTWRRVYWFVFGCFVLVVVLLTIFSRVFA